MLPALDKPTLLETYRRMLIMRRMEEACMDLYEAGHFTSHYHLYIGQEATGAAVGALRDAKDLVYTTHRNHGHLIACGADPGKVLAEILGKATGYLRGRGGTLHGAAPELGILHTSGLVGSAATIAMGSAVGIHRMGQENVVFAFFGDGALEEGTLPETFNLAAMWQAPVIFICENNSWQTLIGPGEYPSSSLRVRYLTDLPAVFDMPSISVDGSDLGATHEALAEARTRALQNGGPTFIEARTRRWPGSKPLWPTPLTGTTDISIAWTRQLPEGKLEYSDWFLRDDPVLQVTRELLALEVLSREEVQKIDADVRRGMQEAVDFAVRSPEPNPQEALELVWP